MVIVIHFKRLIALLLIMCLTASVVFAVTNKPDEEIKLPIIMYHSILANSKSQGEYVVSPTALEKDLKYLKANGYVAVTVTDLYDYVYGGKELPKKPVMLTFDDGFYNNYVYAYPLIKEYDMKMVISVVGEYCDNEGESGDNNPNYSYLTWEQVGELSQSGYCEIQNHSYSLHSLNKGRTGSKKNKGESNEEYAKMLTDDLKKAQNLIKVATSYEPLCYTYPFGGVSNASFEILKDMGFRASLSCGEGINIISADKECLYMLKRFNRTNTRSVEDILN